MPASKLEHNALADALSHGAYHCIRFKMKAVHYRICNTDISSNHTNISHTARIIIA